jgi:hypothetical protein
LEPDGHLKVITPEGEVKTYSRMSKRSSVGMWKVLAMTRLENQESIQNSETN